MLTGPGLKVRPSGPCCVNGSAYGAPFTLTVNCVGPPQLMPSIKMLYVPEGVAHGFITLADGSEVFYQMSEVWSPEHARGVRWNDPGFKIQWPLQPAVIAERDANYPDFVA